MRSLRFIVLAALLAPGAGCKWLDDIKKNAGNKSTEKIPEVAPAAFVHFLNDRADQLHSLEYDDISMRISGKGILVPAMLRGSLAAAQPRYFRMTTAHGLANAKLDMGSNEREFWLSIATPNSEPLHVFASHADFASGRARMPQGIPFEPDWVLQALGMAKYPLDSDYTVAIDPRERTYTLAWTAKIPGGAVRKQVVFDVDGARGNRSQIKKYVIRNAKSNAVIATAEIQSAQRETVGVINSPTPPVSVQYPTRIVLKWVEPRFEMDLNLGKATANSAALENPTQLGLFVRPNIPGVAPIDLAGAYEFK